MSLRVDFATTTAEQPRDLTLATVGIVREPVAIAAVVVEDERAGGG